MQIAYLTFLSALRSIPYALSGIGASREGPGPPFWHHLGGLWRTFGLIGSPWAPRGKPLGRTGAHLDVQVRFSWILGDFGSLLQRLEKGPVGAVGLARGG